MDGKHERLRCHQKKGTFRNEVENLRTKKENPFINSQTKHHWWSTMAVANLKLSKIDINESTINLGESQITVCQDEKNENKDNIEDDIQDDFVPDEVPIEDKEEDDKEEIIENEEKGECSDSQNKVFSTEVKFREKLEKNEEDKNENKIELNKKGFGSDRRSKRRR